MTASTIPAARPASGWFFIADGTAGKVNRLGFGERGIAEAYSSASITDTAWHHVAVAKNGDAGANLTFYLDGVQAGTATVGSVTLPSGPKTIGALNDGAVLAQFGGNLDDVRLYNRALSAAEVLRLATGRGCVTAGSTWSTAMRELQCALGEALPGDQIWIGEGTYRPGLYRFAPFVLVNGVDLIGGFRGLSPGGNESTPANGLPSIPISRSPRSAAISWPTICRPPSATMARTTAWSCWLTAAPWPLSTGCACRAATQTAPQVV